jgi:pyruvate dehydrogenase E1 component alpha subunit
VPVIFIAENNFQYMGVPMALTVPTKYISEYTKGLDIPHHLVDGNDVSAVYAATNEAVEWARAGKGPTVIEGMTYRWYDHAGFAGGRPSQDGAMGLPYRSDDEVKQWMTRDPVVRYKNWLVAKGLAAENEIAGIDAKAQAAVDASIEFARKSADPNPEDGVLNTYANHTAEATQFFNRKNIPSARLT